MLSLIHLTKSIFFSYIFNILPFNLSYYIINTLPFNLSYIIEIFSLVYILLFNMVFIT